MAKTTTTTTITAASSQWGCVIMICTACQLIRTNMLMLPGAEDVCDEEGCRARTQPFLDQLVYATVFSCKQHSLQPPSSYIRWCALFYICMFIFKTTSRNYQDFACGKQMKHDTFWFKKKYFRCLLLPMCLVTLLLLAISPPEEGNIGFICLSMPALSHS